MDNTKLNELTKQLNTQFSQAEQVLQQYEQGDYRFEQVSAELNELHRLTAEIQAEIGDGIRDFYLRAREVKKSKTIAELGFQT